MLKIMKQYSAESLGDLLKQKNRSFIPEEVTDVVRTIIADVKKRGDSAVLEYSSRYDELTDIGSFRVSSGELEAAAARVDSTFIDAIRQSIENVRSFHSLMLEKDFNMLTANGSVLGSKVTAIEKAAVYVPGGKAAYPSTVVMCAVPAIVAGVGEIILLTPPSEGGGINPYVAATAKLLGIGSIFRVGGAQGVAAAAFGTETIPKVDKIVGPGNAYVAAAKREVYGYVDIDMIAGPSEIAVAADGSANPCWVAADLISQAEHDEMARCILVTDSEAFAEQVGRELEQQLRVLKRRGIAEKALQNNSMAILIDNIEKAAEIINEIAPEHLEIITSNPYKLLPKIRNAGAVFIGSYSSEPIGDYIAGTNHVLPTYGTAAFFSPLSTKDFQKRSSIICYSREDLQEYGPSAIRIAEAEGLEAHANALKVRLGT